jgi:hypothetical protein
MLYSPGGEEMFNTFCMVLEKEKEEKSSLICRKIQNLPYHI